MTDSNSAQDKVDRRAFLAAAAGTAFGALTGGCSKELAKSDRQNQLNIYSWADYIHPDTIPEFEKRFGVKVVYDTFSSNEGLLAKMQAGATSYDIIVPTSYMVTQLKKLGLLAPIEHDRLKLLSNLMPRFLNPAFDPHLEHCVPYTWGTTGLGFNADRLGDESKWPRDFDAFWDARFAGRLTLLDDSRETIGMSLKRSGHSYNTKNNSQIEEALADLKHEKPLVMCYTSDQVIVQLAAGDSWLALAYSGDAFQAAKANPAIRFVIPESGTSLWLDNLCIPKTAPHVASAYKWLNFMLEPEIAAATASYTRYASPNAAALRLIEEDLRMDKNLYPSENLLSKCEELGDAGSLIFLYDRLWTELKCV